MQIDLQRTDANSTSTFGELFIGTVFECYTLEDVVRKVKIPKQTAIPAGAYEIIINDSVRFKRLLPLLLDVPGFTGIRIHPGNTSEDTEGCILVGTSRDLMNSRLSESRIAFAALFSKLSLAKVQGEAIFIAVKDVP